jgi:hypothetical protein
MQNAGAMDEIAEAIRLLAAAILVGAFGITLGLCAIATVMAERKRHG